MSEYGRAPALVQLRHSATPRRTFQMHKIDVRVGRGPCASWNRRQNMHSASSGIASHHVCL
eukprot:9591569-Lingulodinium_polyedra.AAC.1